ncbi:hypothetical protein GCM10011586_12630 [Silvibacterium dinghuense]|nr:hypothetical protein GCM10011586_12630 [Silvibacterium dinghuense]
MVVVCAGLLAGTMGGRTARAEAPAGAVATYPRVKLTIPAEQAKSGKVEQLEGTLNLDADSKNVLFVVKEAVQRTIPYGQISGLQFYMANHLLRILYRDGAGRERYVDMELPQSSQADLLKQLQAETGIPVRLT